MADFWNTDTGEAVYRSRDGLIIDCCFPMSPGDNEEELEVGWQEKLFSKFEMELYQDEAVCQTPLDRQYHTEVKALNRARGRKNHRIFTYTDHDRYTNYLPFQQLVRCAASYVTPKSNNPTFLAERMASIRHRRQDRRTMDCTIPVSKIINWEPTEEFVKNSHVVHNSMQTMHIMGDLGPPGRLGQTENEYLLFTLKTDGSGTVVLKPDFNKGREPYRIVTEGDKREVWRLTVENVSTAMKPDEKDMEQNMYKDLYVSHKEYLNSLVGQDFEMPPLGVLRYVMNGEIVSAQGFEYDNLYIHFLMELPNNWSSLPFQSLSGVTQACRTKTLRKDFSLIILESVPQWPVLYFKVLSLTSWQRYRTEGYGYVLFPAIPGKHKITCHTWRPFQTGTVSALRRFFIGGSPELEDHSYVRVPGTFKGERLSRFGFSTETTGSVTFNLHCIQQARSFVDATMLKKRRQKVFDQLGGFSQQGAVCTILEAFHNARRKMQEARESLPRDLINATSQLQMESST
uniref:Meckel syndrome type 1 protein n=1 Tax=Scophthalmus maximus TaxID=52904 RepID=A0A8D3A7E9_SCOMX